MFVPVSAPYLDNKEKELVDDAMIKGEISGFFGNYISDFEKNFAQYCGSKFAVTVSSGTTALHLAILALNIGANDEVIVASFTNMASFFCVLYQGARPIPIDCDPETLNIDPGLIESKIGAKTKAILVVHLYGHPVDMDPILAIAKKHNLFVIEDAAEAHGAEYKGQKVGSIGDIGCFSFYANKIITTGEGGMVTTNNAEIADKVRMFKSLSFGDTNKFMHKAIGYNYRMTNVQAAIGVAQLNKINEIIELKRGIATYYNDRLANIEDIQLPVQRDYAGNVYWMYNIVLKGRLTGKREEFILALKKRGVETREDFIPFNLQEVFIDQGLTKSEDCPNANYVAYNGLYLPSGTGLKADELKFVADSVIEVVAELI